MSNYRRGYNWENIHYIPAPTGGWNPDTNPWELPQDQAPVLDNFLIRPGKITVRGAFKYMGSLGAAPTGFVFMPIPHIVITGLRDTTGGTVEHWNAPLVNASSGVLAKALAGTQWAKDLSSGGNNFLGGTRDTIVGPRSTIFNGLVYTIAYDSASAVTTDFNQNYSIRPVSLLSSSSPPTVTAPITMPSAPHGAFDLKSYQSRIWLLGGIDTPAGGALHSPTTIFFSNPGLPGATPAATDWRDPVSGLTNKITIDNEERDFGVGLALVRGGLLVLRRNSIWLLRGSTSASYTISLVSKEVGCSDVRSIIETDNGVYFISNRGLMLTDGVSVRNVSGSVTYALQQAIAQEQGRIMAGGVGYITCALTSRGTIIVSIGTQNGGTGLLSPLWSAMYDPATNAWTRITSGIFALETVGNVAGNAYPGYVASGRTPAATVIAYGDQGMTCLEDMGSAFSFLQPPYALYDYFAVGSLGAVNPYKAIPAIWKSRYTPIVGTTSLSRKFAQAKRFFLDYVFGAGSLAIGNGWTATPVDSTDTQVAGSSVLTAGLGAVPTATGSVSGTSLVPSPRMQRQNQDFTSEISDLGFDLSWTDSDRAAPPTNVVAEIYGVGVEYAPTRDLRS